MTASAAEKKPYEYYRSIVDRQMFGTPPPGFDPMKMPSEVSKSSQKEISREQRMPAQKRCIPARRDWGEV